MYTYTILSMLLAGNALAAPNPILISSPPHFRHIEQLLPVKRDTPFSSAAYGVLPLANTVTTTLTIFSTVTVPTATTTSTVTISSSALAIPTITDLPEPEPVEESAGVYICEDYNWGGKCEYKLSPLGSSDEDCTILDGTASSIGPDVGFQCLFFTNGYCRSLANDGLDTLILTYPGNSNLLVTEKGDFNDKFHSYLCFKLEAP
ncbi:uncharacterized protein K460DRAFT_43708 [Cucurbitaria berberidis CBS 394.84]|uniref:Uncharacterized protein n=1 Tax=Cucurbitaria berberidis CBS 394.84 TaxID=1168544 RepID=A0A9P4GV69_9PLEO|nr:uncharacterized protein K460DRAFT_43708 [Cucurbitaria berberidis CBS 394.84]KAF1851907.1 hypothetical protein K460DRAFT_43708 [Cucurbitaria berberidis CBS 394.84]